jgi:hypothetical protein
VVAVVQGLLEETLQGLLLEVVAMDHHQAYLVHQ